METASVFAIVAFVCAGAAGYLLIQKAMQKAASRARTTLLLGSSEKRDRMSVIRWWLRHGAGFLNPLAELMLRIPVVRRTFVWLQQSLAEHDLEAKPRALATLSVVALAVCFGVSWLLSGSLVFAVALSACVVIGVAGKVKTNHEKRANELRDSIPDALRSMGVCFKAGLSLMQTLRQTSDEIKGPLGELFLAAARILETGGSAQDALAVFQRSSGADELAFVSVALHVQHQSGGSLSHVLDAARESVENEIELARTLKVQTAQAKLSSRIVTIMPFALVALFSLMSPGFLDPFFVSVPGFMLLCVALIMQAAGVLLVHRMLHVQEG